MFYDFYVTRIKKTNGKEVNMISFIQIDRILYDSTNLIMEGWAKCELNGVGKPPDEIIFFYNRDFIKCAQCNLERKDVTLVYHTTSTLHGFTVSFPIANVNIEKLSSIKFYCISDEMFSEAKLAPLPPFSYSKTPLIVESASQCSQNDINQYGAIESIIIILHDLEITAWAAFVNKGDIVAPTKFFVEYNGILINVSVPYISRIDISSFLQSPTNILGTNIKIKDYMSLTGKGVLDLFHIRVFALSPYHSLHKITRYGSV